MTCVHRNCPDCGDRLVHQTRRGRDEASSAFAQAIHDNLPNDFFLMDADWLVYKKMTRTLRFIEHKYVNQALSPSQDAILPRLAAALGHLRNTKDYAVEESGVYVVWSDPPFTEGLVAEYDHQGKVGPAQLFGGDRWSHFLTGRPFDREVV